MVNVVLRVMTWSLVILAGASCSSVEERRRQAVAAYNRGDLEAAESLIDGCIADVQGEDGLTPASWDLSANAMPLLALERGMIRLAESDAAGARTIFEVLPDVIEGRRVDSIEEFMALDGLDTAGASLLFGDQADIYRAADFEQLALQVMLALCDLLADRRSQLAYANQFDAVQNRLLASDYGVEQFDPGEEYRRLALGSYLEGVIKEGQGNPSNARPAYVEASRILPQSELIREAVDRTTAGDPPAAPGEGVLHVFYFAGPGPERLSNRFDLNRSDPIVELAVRLVVQALDILRRSSSYGVDDALLLQITQLPVPVPYIAGPPRYAPQMVVSAPGTGWSIGAERLADFGHLAAQQIEAMKLMFISRAMLRRTLKYIVSYEVLGDQWGFLGNFALQIAEDADLRSWGTLPSEVQVARLRLPEGEHEIDFGVGPHRRLRVQPGYDSFAVVLWSELSRPEAARVIVDEWSRVDRGGEPTTP